MMIFYVHTCIHEVLEYPSYCILDIQNPVFVFYFMHITSSERQVMRVLFSFSIWKFCYRGSIVKQDVFYLWVLMLRFMIFRWSLKMSVLAYSFGILSSNYAFHNSLWSNVYWLFCKESEEIYIFYRSYHKIFILPVLKNCVKLTYMQQL